MLPFDSAARRTAASCIKRVLLHPGNPRTLALLETLIPNWAEKRDGARLSRELCDEAYQTVVRVVDDITKAILSGKGHVPEYYSRFEKRWKASQDREKELQALIEDPELSGALLRDLRFRARQPAFLDAINRLVIALNKEREVRWTNMIIDAYQITDWALRRARPAPKGQSVWVEMLLRLYVRERIGGGALVAEHEDYSPRKIKFSQNGPTDLRQITDFANLLAKRLDATHSHVLAMRSPNADPAKIWARYFNRDLERLPVDPESPVDDSTELSNVDDDRSAFWEVHDRTDLGRMIEALHARTLGIIIKDGLMRIVDAQGSLQKGTAASILECMIVIHQRSYAIAWSV